MLEYVLKVQDRWPVFPVRNDGSKRPAVTGWQYEATTDPAAVFDWWTREGWETNLVGIPTGKRTGLYVVDVDPGGALPDAAHRGVPRGTSRGTHYYFGPPEGGGDVRNVVGVRPGVDVRGEGGFVIAWHVPPYPYELAPFPEELRVKRTLGGGDLPPIPDVGAEHLLTRACIAVGTAPEGRRNATLNRWAWYTYSLVRGGIVSEEAWRMQLIAAVTRTGYPYEEAQATLDAVVRRVEEGR